MDVGPPSPEQPTGPVLQLDANTLLKYLRTLMKDPKKFISEPHVLTPPSLAVSLSCRDQAIQTANGAFKKLVQAQEGRPGSDRTKLKIPVCAGMSGLGKTRMLEEASLASQNLTQNACVVIVTYGNGHSLRTVEHRNIVFVASSPPFFLGEK